MAARKRKADVRYSRKLFDEILDRMRRGETVAQILRSPGMPTYAAFYEWRRKDAEHDEAYTLAHQAQVHKWIDDAVDLSLRPVDDVPLPEHLEASANESAKIRYKKAAGNQEMQRRRLQIDTMKWLATKILPGLYGDRSKVDLAAQISVETVSFSEENS